MNFDELFGTDFSTEDQPTITKNEFMEKAWAIFSQLDKAYSFSRVQRYNFSDSECESMDQGHFISDKTGETEVLHYTDEGESYCVELDDACFSAEVEDIMFNGEMFYLLNAKIEDYEK